MKFSSFAFAALIGITKIKEGESYCNWNGCNGAPQGGEFCNSGEENCISCGNGAEWCTNAFSYCHWGPLGTGASSTCNVEETGIQSTTYCNANQGQCEDVCRGRYCTNGNANVTPTPPSPAPTPAPTFAPVPTVPTTTPPTSTSVATTTRYWDCSGGACGCAYLPFGPGSDSTPAHCYSNAMFAAPTGNEHGATFYGAAAVSQALGGGDWLAEGCGKCYKVTGIGNIANTDKNGVATTVVLKATNYCPPSNSACCCGKAHFDIAAPGFDYTPSSQSNTCSTREADEATGFASCGNWMISSSDPTQNCNCDSFNNDVLRAGCNNFKSLYWNNVDVDYVEVDCPTELSRLNCWEENGNKYPDGIPEFCASNIDSSATTVAATTTTTAAATTTTTATDPPTTTTEAATTTTTEAATTTTQAATTTTEAATTTTTTQAATTTTTTPAPTLSPTPQPVTPAPTPQPVSTGGNMCCSHNYKTCSNSNPNDWCNQSEDNCVPGCGSGAAWIEEGKCTGIQKWSACTNDETGCCPPATCVDKGNWKQCL